jgi:hypothetical protein
MRQLTPEQIARILEDKRRWEQAPAPCGVPHSHPFNPCLPERDGGLLWCATCGRDQRLELT